MGQFFFLFFTSKKRRRRRKPPSSQGSVCFYAKEFRTFRYTIAQNGSGFLVGDQIRFYAMAEYFGISSRQKVNKPKKFPGNSLCLQIIRHVHIARLDRVRVYGEICLSMRVCVLCVCTSVSENSVISFKSLQQNIRSPKHTKTLFRFRCVCVCMSPFLLSWHPIKLKNF